MSCTWNDFMKLWIFQVTTNIFIVYLLFIIIVIARKKKKINKRKGGVFK